MRANYIAIDITGTHSVFYSLKIIYRLIERCGYFCGLCGKFPHLIVECCIFSIYCIESFCLFQEE